jgi:hypothetical protein
MKELVYLVLALAAALSVFHVLPKLLARRGFACLP